MWIGAIRLRVQTKDGPDSGTDNLVKATIERDGVDIVVLRLDYAAGDDLERRSRRDYDYFTPPRIEDDVEVFVREIGQKTTGFDTVVWQEDTAWTSVGTWSQDVAMSTDSLVLT